MIEQRWFLLDGSEVRLLNESTAGCIVERIYEQEDGQEPRYSKPFYVDAVYAFEHFQREHPDVEAKRKQLAEMNEKLAVLRAEVGQLEKVRPAILARLKQIPALELLEDVIEDRITHYVHEDWAYTSVLDKSALDYLEDGRQCYPKKLRLLSLYGASDGDLQWNIHQYYDGSGNSRYHVWPFKSQGDAVAFAHARLLEKLADKVHDRNPEYLLESFARCGIEAPAELIAKVEAAKEKQRQAKVKQLTDEIAALTAETMAKTVKLEAV